MTGFWLVQVSYLHADPSRRFRAIVRPVTHERAHRAPAIAALYPHRIPRLMAWCFLHHVHVVRRLSELDEAIRTRSFLRGAAHCNTMHRGAKYMSLRDNAPRCNAVHPLSYVDFFYLTHSKEPTAAPATDEHGQARHTPSAAARTDAPDAAACHAAPCPPLSTSPTGACVPRARSEHRDGHCSGGMAELGRPRGRPRERRPPQLHRLPRTAAASVGTLRRRRLAAISPSAHRGGGQEVETGLSSEKLFYIKNALTEAEAAKRGGDMVKVRAHARTQAHTSARTQAHARTWTLA
jgi:hypothetical protein